MVDGQWWQAFLNVYLRRRAQEDEPLVYIHSEETDQEIILTLEEARELRRVIGTLLDDEAQR